MTSSSIFQDPALYDAGYQTLTKDIRFYQKLAIKTKGPILELGIGTGRLALPILQAGIPLVGLDSSSEMLREAQKRLSGFGKLCHLVRGDYTHFHFQQKFALIFSGFNSLHHLFTAEKLLELLHCAQQHLTDDGFFAFDILNPSPDRLLTEDNTPYLRERFFDERTAQACEIWETYKYNQEQQIKTSHWQYRWADGSRKEHTLSHRIYFPQELQTLLDAGGFQLVQYLGDFDGSSFSAVSPKQIVVCKLSSSF
jgi:SAM-dependent methyltransferase